MKERKVRRDEEKDNEGKCSVKEEENEQEWVPIENGWKCKWKEDAGNRKYTSEITLNPLKDITEVMFSYTFWRFSFSLIISRSSFLVPCIVHFVWSSRWIYSTAHNKSVCETLCMLIHRVYYDQFLYEPHNHLRCRSVVSPLALPPFFLSLLLSFFRCFPRLFLSATFLSFISALFLPMNLFINLSHSVCSARLFYVANNVTIHRNDWWIIKCCSKAACIRKTEKMKANNKYW